MFHYAVFKIRLGPEEERDPILEKKSIPDGMASCMSRKQIGGHAVFCILQIVLWLLLQHYYGMSWAFLSCALTTAALAALAMVDMAIYELPPELNLLIAICGAVHLISDISHWYEYLIGAVLVSGLFLLIGLFSRGKAMGGGDVKLTAALGLLLGWQKILLVMLLGSVLGVLFHGIRMLISKKEHTLAFGPYLAMGAIVTMLWGERMIEAYLNLFFR